MILKNLSAGQQWRKRHREQTYGLMGRGEERVRCMERVTQKLILPCVKQIASRNLLYVSGNSNRGSVPTQGVGWDGKGDGREVQEGGDTCTYG